MFFDAAALDDLYEKTQGELHFGVFDHRVLLPLSRLPDLVANEGDEVLPPERVTALIEAGWIPALRTSDGHLGFPLFVPGRVALLLRLERAGVSARELAAFAEYEDGVIASVLTAADTAYEDDDLALLIREYEERVDSLERKRQYASGEVPAPWLTTTAEALAEIERELAQDRRSLAALQEYRWDRLRAETKERIRRHAFKLRFIHENMRVMMTQADRAIVAQGYSFFIAFGGYESRGLEYDDFAFGPINWYETLECPWLTGEEDTLPIRLPGLLLEAETVSMTRMMTPAEYRQAWERFDLDTYKLALAARAGERLCRRCLTPLPAESSPTRKFCSDACKSQAKAQTYRNRYPDRVKAARHR
jgi:hypothetical protein